MSNFVRNYRKILKTLQQVETKMNFLNQIRQPKFSDIELIAIDLTSEYMSIDSEYQLFRVITMTTKLANILHCYVMGMGIKGISMTFKLSRNTVRKYVRLFQESGIPMEQLLSMPASRIQEIFGGSGERERSPSSRQLELEALLPEYAARLTRKERHNPFYYQLKSCIYKPM